MLLADRRFLGPGIRKNERLKPTNPVGVVSVILSVSVEPSIFRYFTFHFVLDEQI